MKLEQSIQRSQKSAGGIIGQTRQVRYVSEWELIYHEVLAITDVFWHLTKSNLDPQETKLHHNYCKVFNSQVQKVLSFVRARRNPYFPTSLPHLHNFVSKSKIT